MEWGLAADYEVTRSWSLGLAASVFGIPKSAPAGSPITQNRFRVAEAVVRATVTRFCIGDLGACDNRWLHATRGSFEGDVGGGVDVALRRDLPSLHILLLGDFHYMPAPSYPSPLSYFGVSIGLALGRSS